MADDDATAKESEPDASPEGDNPEEKAPVADVESAPSAGASASAKEAAPASVDTVTAPKSTGPAYKPSYVFLVVVTVVNLVADLWSKHWAKSHFDAVKPGGSRQVVVVEDLMNFIFAKNRGGAWGLLQDETEALRRPFFLIVSVAAIVFIVSLYRKLQRGQTALMWGLPLVLGGALGNLVDRIRYGYVVDFIDIYGHLPEWVASIGMKPGLRHWPTFNVADISICVGVALMAIDMFTSRAPAAPKTDKDAATKPVANVNEDNVEPGASTSSATAAAAGPAGQAAGDASERA